MAESIAGPGNEHTLRNIALASFGGNVAILGAGIVANNPEIVDVAAAGFTFTLPTLVAAVGFEIYNRFRTPGTAGDTPVNPS